MLLLKYKGTCFSIVLKAQYTLDNSNSKIIKHIHESHSSAAFALGRMLMWYQTFSPNYIW